MTTTPPPPRPAEGTGIPPPAGAPPKTPGALIALVALAAFFSLYLARGFVLPVILATVLALIFRPVVTVLERLRIPSALTAGIVVALLIGTCFYGLSSLYTPATEWIQRAPDAIERLERTMQKFRGSIVEDAGRAAESVERLTNPDGEKSRTVEIKQPGVGARLIDVTVGLVTDTAIVLILLFFLLATGGTLLTRITAFVRQKRKRTSEPQLIHELERQISRYFATITLINAGLGVSVGCALALLGLPNPMLWGVIVAFLNFVPYLGGIVGIIVVGLASTIAFDEPWRMLAAPAVYLALNAIEGMLITPLILGRRFAVDPCFVFIWLFFWGWMWDIPGALLAMPMLTAVKIVSARLPELEGLNRLIASERNLPERSKLVG